MSGVRFRSLPLPYPPSSTPPPHTRALSHVSLYLSCGIPTVLTVITLSHPRYPSQDEKPKFWPALVVGIIFVLCGIPCGFYCWFSVGYNAFRKNSPLRFSIFFCTFFIHITLSVMMSIGYPQATGGSGIIVASSIIKNGTSESVRGERTRAVVGGDDASCCSLGMNLLSFRLAVPPPSHHTRMQAPTRTHARGRAQPFLDQLPPHYHHQAKKRTKGAKKR